MSLSSMNSRKSLAVVAPLEAVLFDIDGTLCDSAPLHFQAFRALLQQIGFNNGVAISEEFYVQLIAGKHYPDIAQALFPDDLQAGLNYMQEEEARFKRLAAEKLEAVAGLYKMIKWVKDRGLKRVAVTNSPRGLAELLIKELGLEDFFEAVVVANDCEHAKPYPEPYLKALEILKVSKDHTFICEDSVSGIRAGVAAGMPVVGLTTRNPENLLMQANPTLLIKNYEDPKLWEALEELDKMSGFSKV